jgi:drug/metabolite transporter (DMT)-like permease
MSVLLFAHSSKGSTWLIFWLHLIAAIAFLIANALTRLVPQMSPSEIALLRSVFMVLFMLLIAARRGENGRIRFDRAMVLQSFLAGSATYLVMFLWFWSLRLLPLASVTTLFYLKIVFAALLSSLLLGERFSPLAAGGAVIVCAGIAVAIGPDLSLYNIGTGLAILSGLLSAGSAIASREVSRRADVLLASLAFSIGGLPIGLAISAPSLTMPDLSALMVIVLVAALSVVSQLALFAAYVAGPLSRNSGFEAIRVVGAALLGAVFLDEPVTRGLLVGMPIICIGLYLMCRPTPSPQL